MNNDLIIEVSTIFYLCSILGYIYELLLGLLKEHKLINPGLLNGPWLPIYGTGGVLLTYLNRFKQKPLKIFFGAFFITSFLEYFTGKVLIHIFHIRLWDYSECFLNIEGLVCLLSAFVFGFGGLIIIYLIKPFIKYLNNHLNKKVLKTILSIISIIFLSDIIATINK